MQSKPQLLWIAREVGILDKIVYETDTIAELQASTDINPVFIKELVTLLEKMGFVEHIDGTYEPTNQLLGFITKTDIRSIGNLPYSLDIIHAINTFPECVKHGKSFEKPSLPNILGAIEAIDNDILLTAIYHILEHKKSEGPIVLFSEGGGTFANRIHHYGQDVVMLVEEEQKQYCKRFLDPTSVDIVQIDSPNTNMPFQDMEFVVITTPLCGKSKSTWQTIFSEIGSALTSNGIVVILEPVSESISTQTRIERLVTSGEQRIFSLDEFQEWLSSAGFRNVEVQQVDDTEYHTIKANATN
ncbi:MAG: hypothetical protein ABEI06_07520 [Halobacteriaceae archaeon]